MTNQKLTFEKGKLVVFQIFYKFKKSDAWTPDNIYSDRDEAAFEVKKEKAATSVEHYPEFSMVIRKKVVL